MQRAVQLSPELAQTLADVSRAVGPVYESLSRSGVLESVKRLQRTFPAPVRFPAFDVMRSPSMLGIQSVFAESHRSTLALQKQFRNSFAGDDYWQINRILDGVAKLNLWRSGVDMKVFGEMLDASSELGGALRHAAEMLKEPATHDSLQKKTGTAPETAGGLSSAAEERLSALLTSIGKTKEDVAQLLAETQKAAKTGDQKLWAMFIFTLVTGLIVGLLLAPFNSYVDFHVKRKMESRYVKPEPVKLVKEAGREALKGSVLLDSYRFVAKDGLVLLASPRATSRTIGKLRLGQAVVVMEKTGNGFTLVRWSAEGKDVVLQGWVYSRYLKRFE